jgi:hypothetical protein
MNSKPTEKLYGAAVGLEGMQVYKEMVISRETDQDHLELIIQGSARVGLVKISKRIINIADLTIDTWSNHRILHVTHYKTQCAQQISD